MRAHIQWLFFKINSERFLIRNNENNENWPNIWKFSSFMKEWNDNLEYQQTKTNQFEIKNNELRQILANIQSWFINEHNLLGKPAKRLWLAKQSELRQLERELQTYQYNLDHPKTELEEYEKQCLLKKIEIGERRIGNCKDELKEAEKAYEDEKRELCQRLSYTREDLQPYLRNPEERIDPITRRIVITSKHYHEWWRKFSDIHPDSAPLGKLNALLDEWYEHNEGEGPEPNPHEIWVEEKTNDSLVFLWRPIVQDTGEKDKDDKEIEGVFLPLLKNYLFNYYGEWYEVSDYQQLNYNLVSIEAQRSIFYNDYLHLAMCQANVILHHSPLSQEEICSCPTSDHYSSFGIFALDYELSLDLYRMGKKEKKTAGFSKNHIETGLPFAYQGVPSLTTVTREDRRFEGFFIDGFEKGLMLFLFGRRLKGNSFSKNMFAIPMGANEETKQQLVRNKIELLDFKWIKGFNQTKKTNDLEGSVVKYLEEEGLLENNMHHFFKDHIRATLFWRNKPIWRGPYWILYNQCYLTETIGNDGNCVTIEGSGLVIAQVKELVSIICEGEESAWKVLVRTIITTGTTAATIAAPAMAGPATVSKTAAKAGVKAAIGGAAARTGAAAAIGVVGGMFQSAFNKLTEEVSYEDFSQTMTIHEFKHKYFTSGINPITLKVEFSRELANQYLNRRELKGQMLYTYGNFLFFGKVLAQKDFLKASVISWNMTRNPEWFREKIESGVFLYEDDHKEFYKKPLTEGKMSRCRGGVIRCDWDEFVMEGEKKIVKQTLLTANMTNADYSNADYIGSSDSALWSQMCSQMKRHDGQAPSHPGNSPIPNECLGCLTGGGHKGNSSYHYKSTMNVTVGGTVHLKTQASGVKTCLVPSGGGTLVFECQGTNLAEIYIEKEIFDIRKMKNHGQANPAGIPPSEWLPTDPAHANAPPAKPFNPNQFPSSGNLTPGPTGSGEFEPNVPDIDVSPDPDFDQSLDPDFGVDTDTDPTQDPDIPPDGDPYDPDDDND